MVGLRRSPIKRSTRKADPVTPELRVAVLQRDGGCLAVTVGRMDPATCAGRLTLDHVKSEPRMGKRAPSDAAHLATVCEFHHLYGWATANRPALREYLRSVA